MGVGRHAPTDADEATGSSDRAGPGESEAPSELVEQPHGGALTPPWDSAKPTHAAGAAGNAARARQREQASRLELLELVLTREEFQGRLDAIRAGGPLPLRRAGELAEQPLRPFE